MPTTLTDSSSFDAMTAPIGTDIRNAASVRTCLQAAANRDRFVYDMVTPLADIAALKAISAPADGTVRSVVGHGAYVFVSSYVGAETLPWAVAPDVGAGRWVSMAASLSEYEGGIEKHHAPLDDIAALKAVTGQAVGDTRLVSGKGTYVFTSSTQNDLLPWVVKPNVGLGSWHLAQHTGGWKLDGVDYYGNVNENTDSDSWTTVAVRHYPSCALDDTFVIDADGILWLSSSGYTGAARLVVETPSGIVPIGHESVATTYGSDVVFSRNALYRCVEPGSHSVRIQIKSSVSGSVTVLSPLDWRVMSFSTRV